jgi:site-specific recombinase XerD
VTSTSLSYWLHSYFHEWLGNQRNCSRHTVQSYRDTWRLLLRHVAERHHRPVSALTLDEITDREVLAFLAHVEADRHDTISTRNCRLAAIRSFYSYVAANEPLLAALCAAVLRIPIKKTTQREVGYLDTEEVTAILRQPDRSTPEGQRDHALLAFLYNTGARIQEALSVTPGTLRLAAPAQVRLYGKGRKERVCPLWPETAALLSALLKRQPRSDHEPLFANRYGRPLGATGVRYKLALYVKAAATDLPSLHKKRVTPHTFRHTAGVQLVAAGVDITVIRSWLGHVSLDTTNHYARANLETKRRALERVDRSTRPGKPLRWKRNPDLLNWLDSL